MTNHGVYVKEKGTAVQTPVEVESAIPVVVGLAPVQCAEKPATAGARSLYEPLRVQGGVRLER